MRKWKVRNWETEKLRKWKSDPLICTTYFHYFFSLLISLLVSTTCNYDCTDLNILFYLLLLLTALSSLLVLALSDSSSLIVLALTTLLTFANCFCTYYCLITYLHLLYCLDSLIVFFSLLYSLLALALTSTYYLFLLLTSHNLPLTTYLLLLTSHNFPLLLLNYCLRLHLLA